jgi:hypothetical protein
MHQRNDPKWPLVCRIGNEVIPHACETEVPRGEVGAALALIGKPNEGLDCSFDGVDDAICNLNVVLRYKIPKCRQGQPQLLRETHIRSCTADATGGALCPKSREYFVARNKLYTAAVKIVAPPIDRLPR